MSALVHGAPDAAAPTPAAAPATPPLRDVSLVLFGATGDLARRKLIPALYNLAADGLLPERFRLVGVARSPLDDEAFRARVEQSVRAHSRRPPERAALDRLLANVRYLAGSAAEDETHRRLGALLTASDPAGRAPARRLFHLSLAPALFDAAVERIGIVSGGAGARVLVEKPFGTTLAEAQALNARLTEAFPERQIFRIDHYLGKETVQNILALRFSNALLEPLWNARAIQSVSITAAEQLGVGERAGYYDRVGALRDLVQNHLLQLLSLVAMERPAGFGAEQIRDEKVRVLRAIAPPSPAAAVRGRYERGTIAGEPVAAYREEPGVAKGSRTETYAALRLTVDTPRWAGVPFYLRTGKRLPRKATEVAIAFRPSSGLGPAGADAGRNSLQLRLDPDEGVSLTLGAKRPGPGHHVEPVELAFSYRSAFGSQSPEAYERLLLDAMRGDATLFTRSDEVEAQWRICDPLLTRWADGDDEPLSYAAGSDGPRAAHALLASGDSWGAL